MTNGIAGLLVSAVPVVAPNGEARLDEETGQVSFASLFAGAAQALAQQPVPLVVKPEGASELDASSDTENVGDADDTRDTGVAGDTDKADDPKKADATTRDAGDKTPMPLPRDPAPNGIDRSIAALDPALQERLGRVMARMRQETGHEVQVGETYRSQSRQNALYAQGRSAPGPVVTWTQSSKHTKGRAVDLVVDGGSADSEAYAALRRIATQEGLRTLGERDPGHLELPGNLSRAAVTQIANATTIKSAVTSAPIIASSVANAATVESPIANQTPIESSVARGTVFKSPMAKVAAFKSSIANLSSNTLPLERSVTTGSANVTTATTAPNTASTTAATIATATTTTTATTAPQTTKADAPINSPSGAIRAEHAAPEVAVRSAPAVVAAIQTMSVDAPNAGAVAVARVSQIAPTARVVNTKVDRPADVARVAAVARPGVANSATRVPPTQHPAPALAQGSAIANQTNARNQQSGANPGERSQQNTGDRDSSGYGAAYGVGRRAGSEFTIPSIVAATSTGTSAAHRAAEIVATREDAPARPLSQIVMAVDAGNGTTDRIQLDLRGSSLNATIDAGDQRAAHAMGEHKSELVRTLSRDGLDVESLEIRATTTAAAPAAAESAHRSSDSSSHSRSERGGQWQQQQNRQRSENERRQQQRDERGGNK